MSSLPIQAAEWPVVARPSRPCLTPRVASALRASVRWFYPRDGGPPIPVLATDWHPPLLDEVDLAAARVAIADYRRGFLAPADPEWLAARLASHLSHRWVPDLDEGSMALWLSDWNADLGDHPKWAVDEMCREQRHGEPRNFTIAVAVGICRRLTASARAEFDGLGRLVDPREQKWARRRQAERDAEDRRAAEARAFNEANPNWHWRDERWRHVGGVAPTPAAAQQLGEGNAEG